MFQNKQFFHKFFISEIMLQSVADPLEMKICPWRWRYLISWSLIWMFVFLHSSMDFNLVIESILCCQIWLSKYAQSPFCLFGSFICEKLPQQTFRIWTKAQHTDCWASLHLNDETVTQFKVNEFVPKFFGEQSKRAQKQFDFEQLELLQIWLWTPKHELKALLRQLFIN